MDTKGTVAASLSLDAVAGDARAGFELASEARYRGVSFATNHAELSPDELTATGRRHLRKILSSKDLVLDAIRVASPRGALTDPASIDRTIDNARKAFLLAADLGVRTVALNVGDLGQSKTP